MCYDYIYEVSFNFKYNLHILLTIILIHVIFHYSEKEMTSYISGNDSTGLGLGALMCYSC